MNPTLKQLAGEVRDGRDDQVAQPLAARHDLLRQLDLWVARGWPRALDRAFVADRGGGEVPGAAGAGGCGVAPWARRGCAEAPGLF